MASEATSLGLELNWQKTKIQAVGSREDVPSTITVLGQEVAVVEECLSWLQWRRQTRGVGCVRAPPVTKMHNILEAIPSVRPFVSP